MKKKKTFFPFKYCLQFVCKNNRKRLEFFFYFTEICLLFYGKFFTVYTHYFSSSDVTVFLKKKKSCLGFPTTLVL